MLRKRWFQAGVTLTLLALLIVGLSIPGTGYAQENERPLLGVRIQNTDDGALVVEVLPDSPADEAGLRPDDLITAVDDEPVTADNPLAALILAHVPGDTVTLTVERGGETLELEATLGTAPAAEEETPAPPAEPSAGPTVQRYLAFGGATFQMTDAGWEVTDVDAGSIADEAGLQVGDVVTTLNGDPVTDLTIGDVAPLAAMGGEVTLGIERQGETSEITLELPPGTPFFTYQAHTVEMAPAPFGPRGPFGGGPFGRGGALAGARAYLGVHFQTLTPEVLDSLDQDVPVEEGALITAVEPDSPAADAGLAEGDVITAVNDEPVDAEHTLADRLYAYEPGDTVTLTVARGEETLTLDVTLAESPLPGANMPFGFYVNPNFDFGRFLDEHPEFGELLQQFDENFDPEAFREYLREHGGMPLIPFGPGQMFTNPDFDWQGFLEENPDIGQLLEHLAPNFDWQRWLEELPRLPGINGQPLMPTPSAPEASPPLQA